MRYRKPYFMPRKIGGKLFKYHTTKAVKAEAEKAAKELRKQGFHARIMVTKDWGGRGFDIYKRKRRR